MNKNKVYVAEINERPFAENFSQNFRKTPEERKALLQARAENLKARRKEFGSDYKKHLNVPENSLPK